MFFQETISDISAGLNAETNKLECTSVPGKAKSKQTANQKYLESIKRELYLNLKVFDYPNTYRKRINLLLFTRLVLSPCYVE